MSLGLVGQLRISVEEDRPTLRTRPGAEAALFRAYGRVGLVDPEPCACGGEIAPGRVELIAAAVESHNATERHLAWRDRQGD